MGGRWRGIYNPKHFVLFSKFPSQLNVFVPQLYALCIQTAFQAFQALILLSTCNYIPVDKFQLLTYMGLFTNGANMSFSNLFREIHR
jgi:hypothetical protein